MMRRHLDDAGAIGARWMEVIEGLAGDARRAAFALQHASDEQRQDVVRRLAHELRASATVIEGANQRDLETGWKEVKAKRATAATLQCLPFRGAKVEEAAAGLDAIAALPDPLGRRLRETQLDHGLVLRQVSVPLGVVLCALEARPDAVVQVIGLALRSGNALLVKFGAEAAATSAAIVASAREALASEGLPAHAVAVVATREEFLALLRRDELVDLVVPRGSSEFVRSVRAETRIPVLGQAGGVCHTYVDRHADIWRAIAVCVDAKTDSPVACNATEAFLVHREVATVVVPALVAAMRAHGVEVRADPEAQALAPLAARASEEDWGREFGDLTCLAHVVGSVHEAVMFINAHGSHHTDAILTQDRATARAFVEGVDSANVFVNASTRFSDGLRYGLGAEVGVSTGKLHARGPVGLEGLTSTKWVLYGQGHCAREYRGQGRRRFLHEGQGNGRDPPNDGPSRDGPTKEW